MSNVSALKISSKTAALVNAVRMKLVFEFNDEVNFSCQFRTSCHKDALQQLSHAQCVTV